MVIVLIGISGSGKTTWTKKCVEELPWIKVICPDDIRKELTGDISNQSANGKVWATAYARLDECVKNNTDVVFDSTACNTKTLEELIKHCSGTEIYFKIFNCDVETAHERIKKDLENKVDRSQVPLEVLERQYEGFKKADHFIRSKYPNSFW